MPLKIRNGIMDITPYVGGKSSYGDRKMVKLSSNENALGASPKAIAAYKECADNLERYPDGGSAKLREAIGEVYNLNPEQIVCGAGSDEIIAFLCSAYAGEGDEILYTEHGFLMYAISAKRVGATPVVAPEKNLTTDVDALIAAVTPRTKIVFFANPNNPTGSYISASEIKRLRQGLPEDVLLVIDGAYTEYVDESDYSDGVDVVDNGDNTVMTRTFSKIYGLASQRVGWAYCPSVVADVLNRVRGPFNVTSPAIAAASAAVMDLKFTEKSRLFNKKQLTYLTEEITKSGFNVYPSVGNFVLVDFITSKNADKAYESLLEGGIIARKVGNYGLEYCIRITVGKESENKMVVGSLQKLANLLCVA
jgi:histidinol-phosphate aminotransferase